VLLVVDERKIYGILFAFARAVCLCFSLIEAAQGGDRLRFGFEVALFRKLFEEYALNSFFGDKVGLTFELFKKISTDIVD
jgi:hypothetical protein